MARIIELTTENVLNVRAIHIVPEGDVVTLTGENGAGKSSVLDSLFIALTGKKPEEVIRHGEPKAEIVVKTEDFEVHRVFTKKSMRLEVYMTGSKDSIASPQAFLDKVIGRLAFDPLQFANMKAGERTETLADMIGLDTSAVDEEIEQEYVERTAAGRQLAKATGHLEQLGGRNVNFLDTPDEEVTSSSLWKELEAAEEYEREAAKWANDKRIFSESAAGIEEEIKELADMIEAKRRHLSERRQDIEEHAKKKPAASEARAASQIREDLETLDHTNSLVRQKWEHKSAVKNEDECRSIYEGLDKRIAELRTQRQRMVSDAKFPVEGLEFDEEGLVRFQGVPFGQLSTGQQIGISTRIAMHLNPSLKVIIIKQGSLLDDSNMAAVLECVSENGYQVWIEKVDSSGKVGFFLEDGALVSVDGTTLA